MTFVFLLAVFLRVFTGLFGRFLGFAFAYRRRHRLRAAAVGTAGTVATFCTARIGAALATALTTTGVARIATAGVVAWITAAVVVP